MTYGERMTALWTCGITKHSETPPGGSRCRNPGACTLTMKGASIMVTPYLKFNGNCAEALAFYQKVFQSEPSMLIPYGDYVPEGIEAPPQNLSSWVMHAKMIICGTEFSFADETQVVASSNMISLMASVPTAKVGQTYFDLLTAGGNITLPPTATFYSNFHAAITDKFGINWHIISEEAPEQQ